MLAEIDPLAMLNQSTFFDMNNAARLAQAKTYLIEATNLMAAVTVGNVTIDDTMTQTDIDDAIELQTALNGNGIYSNGEVGLLEETIDLGKIFSSTNYLDRDDFTIPTQYYGASTEARTEYERMIALSEEQFQYGLSQCQDYNHSLVQPVWDINTSLIYGNPRETVVTLNEDASIVAQEPMYGDGTFTAQWVDYSNNCQVNTYTHID